MYWFLLLVGLLGIAYVYWSHSSRRGAKNRAVGIKVERPQSPQNEAPDFVQKKLDEIPEVPQSLDFEKKQQEPRAQASKNDLHKKADKEFENGAELEAEKLLIQVIAIDDNDIPANEKLGMIYLKRGLAAKAEPFFQTLKLLEPENVSHLSHLGYALFMQNRLDEAKETYKSALSMDDSRPGRFASLAQVHMALKEFEEAVKLLNQALEMAPENVDFLLLLADNHQQMENSAETISVLEKVLEISPEHEEAKTWLLSLNSN